MTRAERLMPDGIPRYVRIYDNDGETLDRYTVIFSGRWKGRVPGTTYYVGMSKDPYYPQGFCQHGELQGEMDRPSYSHLGKKIKFQDLPIDCQKVVLDDYNIIWRIP